MRLKYGYTVEPLVAYLEFVAMKSKTFQPVYKPGNLVCITKYSDGLSTAPADPLMVRKHIYEGEGMDHILVNYIQGVSLACVSCGAELFNLKTPHYYTDRDKEGSVYLIRSQFTKEAFFRKSPLYCIRCGTCYTGFNTKLIRGLNLKLKTPFMETEALNWKHITKPQSLTYHK